jgi:phage terminase large subunit-like protein
MQLSTEGLKIWPKLTRKSWSKANLTPDQIEAAACDWFTRGRIEQIPPRGDWNGWLLIGGRGSGKTRAGAEWINALVRGLAVFSKSRVGQIALVGETLADVRDVMVEGPSGILAAAHRGNRPKFEVSRRRVVWPNGAIAMMFSAEDPDSLRGPQFEAAWCDELAKWKYDTATFDMLQFGLRLGDWPRQLITTTPKPTGLIKKLMADPAFVVSKMRTKDNAENLALGFMAMIEKRYAGSRLGRQELDGELIEDRDGALWTRAILDPCFVAQVPQLQRVVVAIDPPVTSTARSDACGIVVAGIDNDGVGWVLEDASFAPAPPGKWGSRAAALYEHHSADAIVIEVNQGGDLVTGVLRSLDQNLPVKAVRATRGKALRAEPVAALYEQGRVKHAARFSALEDEMCDFTAGGLSNGKSPDRLDALVWALTDLMLERRGRPKVRAIG